MRAPVLVHPGGRDAAPDALPGDSWQGDLLNRLIPLLERNGYKVLAGSVCEEGFSVAGIGGRARIELVSPTTLCIWPADDETPSDQWPTIGRDN